MYRFTISVMLIAVASTSVIAFPQNDVNIARVSQADGFVFDGPIERTGPMTSRSDTNTNTVGKTDRTTTTRATPAPTTPGSEAYERCVSSCLTTPEYNPVCGTDDISYDNPGKLGCAAACGKKVDLHFYGRCAADGIRG